MRVLFILAIIFVLSSKILGYQNATSCSGNNFFDTTMMDCLSCYGNQISNTELTCKCANGNKIADGAQIGFEAACIACPTVQMIIFYFIEEKIMFDDKNGKNNFLF